MNKLPYMLSLRSSIHNTIAHILTPKSFAIDATAGNGYDTLFLAQHIKEKEHIFAFDIQHQAIAKTYQRLCNANRLHTTTLFHIGHETMYATLALYTNTTLPRYDAILFNLGYLPHSNKQCITIPQTTLQALDASLQLLSLGGILSIHTYHGHQGGYEEYQHIYIWSTTLNKQYFRVFTLEEQNRYSHREVAFFIQKIASLKQ